VLIPTLANMSDLFPCPSCSKLVASNAAACPLCGHAFKLPNSFSWRDPVHISGLLLMVGIVAALALVFIVGLGRD
jgi:hypothetical protein